MLILGHVKPVYSLAQVRPYSVTNTHVYRFNDAIKHPLFATLTSRDNVTSVKVTESLFSQFKESS